MKVQVGQTESPNTDSLNLLTVYTAECVCVCVCVCACVRVCDNRSEQKLLNCDPQNLISGSSDWF